MTPTPTGDGVGRRVALSAVALFVARVGQFLLSMLVTVALVRYLGPSDYGDFVFVLSVASMLVVLGDFGLIKVAVREITRSSSAEPTVLGTLVAGRLLIAAVLAICTQAILFITGAREEVRVAIAIASLWFAGEALLSVVVVFQVRIAMQFEALLSLVAHLVQAFGAFWLMANGGTMHQIVALPALGALAAALLGAAIARARYGVTVRVDPRLMPGLMLAAIPIGITVAIAVVNLKLDGILLGVMATPEDVGLYGAAAKLIEYVGLAAVLFMNPAYPLLVRWYQEDHDRFRWLYARMTTVLLLGTLPVAVGIAMLAGPLMAVLYPSEFAGSAAALPLLSAALALMVINAWHGFVLLAAGRQRLTLMYDAVALIANVVLNLALIPSFGYMGTAWAALGTSAIAGLWSIHAVSRIGARFDATPLIRLTLMGIGFAAVLWGCGAAGLPSISAALVASLVYGVLLLFLRVVSWDEIRSLIPRRPALISPAPELEVL